MRKKQKSWFNRMLSEGTDVSSKRVASLFVLLNIIVFCYIAVFVNKLLPEFMFDGLALIAGGGLGLTVIEAIFKKPKYQNTIINEQPQINEEVQTETTDTTCTCSEHCACKVKNA